MMLRWFPFFDYLIRAILYTVAFIAEGMFSGPNVLNL